MFKSILEIFEGVYHEIIHGKLFRNDVQTLCHQILSCYQYMRYYFTLGHNRAYFVQSLSMESPRSMINQSKSEYQCRDRSHGIWDV